MYNFSEKEFQEVHGLIMKLLKAFKQVCDKEGVWYSLAYGSVLGAVRHKGIIPWDADVDVFIKINDVDKFRAAFYKNQPQGIMLNDRSKNRRNTKSHDTLYFEEYPGYPDLHLDIYPLIGAPDVEKVGHKKPWRRNYNLDRIFRSKYVKLSECLDKNKKKVFFVKILDRLIPDTLIRYIIHKHETEYDLNSSRYWTCLASPYTPVEKKVWDKLELMKFEDDVFYVPGDWDLFLKTCYGDYMTPRVF